MTDPVFRLAGVVKSRDEPGDFEGPLTLILHLLSRNRIAIADISVSLILRQYLEYIEAMAEMDLDVASEFVAMASHLAYIKTRTLLAGDEEVSELDNLISSLERLRSKDAYVRIKEVVAALGDMYFSGAGLMIKLPEPIAPVTEYKYRHEASDLSGAMRAILERGAAFARAPNMKPVLIPMRAAYPVDEKIEELVEVLRRRGVTRVFALFEDCGSRSEVVATFVAILELCKLGGLMLAGEGAEMTVSVLARDARETPETEE
jgi:segregation and condensation protein A